MKTITIIIQLPDEVEIGPANFQELQDLNADYFLDNGGSIKNITVTELQQLP